MTLFGPDPTPLGRFGTVLRQESVIDMEPTFEVSTSVQTSKPNNNNNNEFATETLRNVAKYKSLIVVNTITIILRSFFLIQFMCRDRAFTVQNAAGSNLFILNLFHLLFKAHYICVF